MKTLELIQKRLGHHRKHFVAGPTGWYKSGEADYQSAAG